MENNRRLIDADALMQDINAGRDYIVQDPEISSRMKWCEAVHYSRTNELIDNAPTVDAVEVVRCRECEHYNSEKKRCDHPRLE